MKKLWAGRAAEQVDAIADDFNSSIGVDCRMYRQDITGSMAHAAMLAAKGIITQEEADALIAGLENILADLDIRRFAHAFEGNYITNVRTFHDNLFKRVASKIRNCEVRFCSVIQFLQRSRP